MQILTGHYPMTIQQMKDWAKQVSGFDQHQCGMAEAHLERRVTIRRGD